MIIHALKFSNVLTAYITPLLQEGDEKKEYRSWNPFRSKLAAAILGGVDAIHMKPGTKVLYLGAASGTTVSHVSDLVGPVSNHDSLYSCSLFSSTRDSEQELRAFRKRFFFYNVPLVIGEGVVLRH